MKQQKSDDQNTTTIASPLIINNNQGSSACDAMILDQKQEGRTQELMLPICADLILLLASYFTNAADLVAFGMMNKKYYSMILEHMYDTADNKQSQLLRPFLRTMMKVDIKLQTVLLSQCLVPNTSASITPTSNTFFHGTSEKWDTTAVVVDRLKHYIIDELHIPLHFQEYNGLWLDAVDITDHKDRVMDIIRSAGFRSGEKHWVLGKKQGLSRKWRCEEHIYQSKGVKDYHPLLFKEVPYEDGKKHGDAFVYHFQLLKRNTMKQGTLKSKTHYVKGQRHGPMTRYRLAPSPLPSSQPHHHHHHTSSAPLPSSPSALLSASSTSAAALSSDSLSHSLNTKSSFLRAVWYYEHDQLCEHNEYAFVDGESVLLERTEYQNGVKHGTNQQWHPNGVLVASRQYANGILSGMNKQWYETGLSSYVFSPPTPPQQQDNSAELDFYRFMC